MVQMKGHHQTLEKALNTETLKQWWLQDLKSGRRGWWWQLLSTGQLFFLNQHAQEEYHP